MKYRTDLRGMDRKAWQEYEIGVPCESLHIQRVHDALHEQPYDCACVNNNVCEREKVRDKERTLIQLQVSDCEWKVGEWERNLECGAATTTPCKL